IEKAKNLYSLFQMKKVLGNCNYVCESMVETITTHERQLKEFKSFIKKYYSTKYHEIFRAENTKVVNYAHYINQTKYNGGKKVLGLELPSTEKRTKDNFYKYIKGILNTKIENETQEYLALRNEFLELIENDNFLPKPRSKNNSVLPNKLYEKELMQILKVNEQKYEFLKEIDAEFGITTSQKICQILTFRVPYFVGPITDKTNKNAWAIKLSNQALKPWNIEQIIDYSQAEEEFIKRMVKKCTYMPKYNAMPKKSLLYSEFCVLNELNNLTINGNLITIKEKQFIYDYGFKKHKKVTLSILRQLLISNGFYTETDLAKDSFGGIDKGFANSLSTYVSLCEKFGQEFVNEHKQYFEKVIFYSTISSDKDRFVKKLKKEFTIFTDDQIKFLKSITCTDWGRISKEFLTTTFIDKSTGELTSVIQELYNKNYNLQQIINSQNYTLEERLQQDTTADLETLTYEAVEELYCSPAVKRGVWQAVKIIKEIVATMGKMPSKIFVEVTRSDEQKGDAGRKKSRKDTLTEIYAECLKDSSKELTKELNQLIDQLNNKNDANLRSEMLYLYFLQQGKCMYTGEPIAIADLFNNNVYDVDHIVPQSVLKDDSIDNKVLVKKQTNLEKSDRYPLPSNWIAKQKDFWAMLNKYKFISDKKYQKLIRRTELSSQELGDFIARQLVETNQSCKAVIEFLKAVLDNPRDVVYSKAGRVSDFRHKYDILKCRDVNDYHHAKDAYLNVVVGNVLFNRFTNNPRHFYADKSKNKNAGLTKHVLKLFDTTVKEFFGDKVVWDKQVHLPIVKETCLKNDCLISYMSYCNYNTAFYKETIHKSLLHNKKSEAKISLKGEDNALSNFEKYGGFTDYNSAYFMVVKSDKRGKIITTIETVTAYLYKKYNGDSNKILQHIAKEQGLVNAQIVLDRINIKSTIKIGKGEYLLAGKSSDVYILHNFNEWKTSKEINDYVRIIAKYNDFVKNKKDKLLTILDDQIIISDKSERGTTQLILSKEKNLWLYNCIIQQLQKEMYDFSSFLIILEYLTKNKELFYGLEIKAQVSLLTSLIKKLSIGASTVNLSQINGKPTVG
ncbi:MAG: type II CRISPR RNA-guided endonuclease Cas9, partial [Clostridia bacterium]|nr:type II CRISPR RNA-guided endonuclease Cas9 [Clostridia bacterium]